MKRFFDLSVAALVVGFSGSINAQEKPFGQPGTAPPVGGSAPLTAATLAPDMAPAEHSRFSLLQSAIPDAIAKGKFNLNARLRFEYVDQEGIPAIADSSYAPTVRTRLGYTTAPLYGFRAMLEAEDIRAIGSEHNFNAAGTSRVPYKPVVADPTTTELNQAWLSYAYTNLISIKAGRQRIALDNHRFVGDVAWRQNMQTYDAVALEGEPIDRVSLFYGYIWDVHRVFGDVEGLPAASRDFSSDSHLLHASYSGWKYGRFVSYAYLLDLENRAGRANSCATYGGYFAGTAPIENEIFLGYRAEAAWQMDYAGNPFTYGTEYYNLELSAARKPFSVGAGYEVLGSDNGQGFRTPLSTLHAFNGWADVFLNTPAAGLRDLYAFGEVIFSWDIPLRVVYHKFAGDSCRGNFGQEIDVQATKKFGKHWTALVKYAFYDGQDVAPPALAFAHIDVHKFWAQVEFSY